MAITVNDLHDLIRLLEEHPEWRAEMRRVLLTDELLQLPDLVRDLIEAQRRTEQQLAELVQITREHSQMLAQHSQILAQHSQTLAEHSQTLAEHSQTLAELLEVSRQHSQVLAQHSQTLAEHSQTLAELLEVSRQHSQVLAQHSQTLAEHSQTLAQHSQTLAELLEVSRQHTQAITELREAQQQTQQTVQRIEQTTMWLVDWQRGEAGRRTGMEYEQRVIRRGTSLFAGGEGGSPEKLNVNRRLRRWLKPIYQGERVPDMAADPFMADIIWWKGDEVMVAEISIKVDRDDIRRARQRADTLREVGVSATPAVIGEEWATPETQALAQQEGVEWMVGGGLSQGFLHFRRLPAEESAEEAAEA